jgi:RNA polymerase sigma-70 factor (sigma-E family)
MSRGASAETGPEPDATFEQFVSTCSATLLRSAYLLTGDHGQAEDLLQLTLLRTARRWQAARDSPQAYARRVLVNLSRDRKRRARRRVSEYPLDDATSFSLADDHAEVIVGRDAVIRALRRLPVRQREVVVLRFYLDLSVSETAAAIGSSEGTVKSYTARALARMRELLADPLPTISEHAAEVPNDH